jgi:ABC-type Na+ transport system ATPase subunit NatA
MKYVKKFKENKDALVPGWSASPSTSEVEFYRDKMINCIDAINKNDINHVIQLRSEINNYKEGRFGFFHSFHSDEELEKLCNEFVLLAKEKGYDVELSKTVDADWLKNSKIKANNYYKTRDEVSKEIEDQKSKHK